MREIKFRAWDNEKDCFINPLHCDLYDLDEIQSKSDRFIIQQFTSCLDSGGTEVFEGDIVENSKNLYEVVFDENNSSFEANLFKTVGCSHIYTNHGGKFCSYKVIGNIFENSELLEKKL